ncbi:hypothetical protein EYF80_067959 [Liparis tanakae]|uniref:Uncharacterized protein n=1 Tax=Liparis tanakae TaxID=230148 RepID=A0A4Z2DZP1_9TELE|nr:hypothetical protein EYF80_067959 [Liparis tanakae]
MTNVSLSRPGNQMDLEVLAADGRDAAGGAASGFSCPSRCLQQGNVHSSSRFTDQTLSDGATE